MKRKQKKKIMLLMALVILVITCVVFSYTAFAIEPTVDFYEKWDLRRSSWLWSSFRQLGWAILMLIRNLVNAAEHLFNLAIDFLGFGIAGSINTFIQNNVEPFISLLLGIGITFLGLAIVFHYVDRNKLIINFVMLIVALFGLPMIMNEFTAITSATMHHFVSGSNNFSTTDMVLQNITDFLYLDDKNFSDNLDKQNNLQESSFIGIKIDETIEPNNSLKNKEIFNSEVTTDISGNTSVATANFGGFIGIGKSYYYRYNFDFISIFLMLASSLIVFLFSSFKTIRICFEIAYGRAFGILITPLDITTGSKIKKFLFEMLTLYASLIFLAMCYKFYLLACNYVSFQYSNPFVKALFIFFLSIVMIDGPNMVERIIGTDVGVKSAMGSLMSTFYMGTTIQNLSRGMSGGSHRFHSTNTNIGNNATPNESTQSDVSYPNSSNVTENTSSVTGETKDSNSEAQHGPNEGVPYTGPMGYQDPMPDDVSESVYGDSIVSDNDISSSATENNDTYSKEDTNNNVDNTTISDDDTVHEAETDTGNAEASSNINEDDNSIFDSNPINTPDADGFMNTGVDDNSVSGINGFNADTSDVADTSSIDTSALNTNNITTNDAETVSPSPALNANTVEDKISSSKIHYDTKVTNSSEINTNLSNDLHKNISTAENSTSPNNIHVERPAASEPKNKFKKFNFTPKE